MVDVKVRFEVSSYDRSRTLTIDPVIEYSTDYFDAGFTLLSATDALEHETFWGRLLFYGASGAAIDSHGHTHVTGVTRSTGFPRDSVLNPSLFQASRSGNIDAWVVKHQRDSPVFVPALTWEVVALVLLLGWYGSRSVRRVATATNG